MTEARLLELTTFAAHLRRSILRMNCHAGSGHPGGSLSCADIMAVLFSGVLNFSPQNADNPDRDRFILSKGHSCLTLYAALAARGFFPESAFATLRHAGGMLQGHPDRLKTPGVEFNSGSLGQGFSFALGVGLGGLRAGRSFRVYALLGDGECNEGQVWEGFMFGARHGLSNVTAIIDYNKYQSDDLCENVAGLAPLADKIRAFGWNAVEIDGHDFGQIEAALTLAREKCRRPTCLVAHTVKGKGISFMENVPKWHGSLAPAGEERACALRECGCDPTEFC